MAKTARERLVRLLDDSATTGAFSAGLPAPAHFLHLEVADVGRVRGPLDAGVRQGAVLSAAPGL
jgi:hypothetical protein